MHEYTLIPTFNRRSVICDDCDVQALKLDRKLTETERTRLIEIPFSDFEEDVEDQNFPATELNR